MGLFAVLAACAALAGSGHPAHSGLDKPDCQDARTTYRKHLSTLELTPEDRDAIARVTLAEAANQGDSGLAGVVYTILNRVISTDFGDSVEAVVNAPNQFEPVARVGTWRRLPRAGKADQAKVDTIVNLALSGRLPDLTNGALFFQNPAIVARRAATGSVPSEMVDFGGTRPSAVIGDHSFYADVRSAGPGSHKNARPGDQTRPGGWDIYRSSRAATWNAFAGAKPAAPRKGKTTPHQEKGEAEGNHRNAF